MDLKTEEQLKSIVQENHPILLRIRDRERKIEQLSEHYPTAKLSSCLEEAIGEHGYDSEQAQEYQAAINWQKNADEIKKFQKEYSDLHYSLFCSEFPFSVHRKPTEEEMRSYNLKRQKYFSAESSLRWAIQSAVTKQDRWDVWYHNWNKDYDFRNDFEQFLSDITSARQRFREQLREESGQEIRDLVQKYLDNPLWHLPQITNFLLLDLIDFDLVSLEVTFYFNLFDPNISNEIDGLHSNYYPSLNPLQTISPCLAPKTRKTRRKRRLQNFWMAAVLGIILWVPFIEEGQTISDVWINEGAPSWIFSVISVIAGFLIVRLCGSLVLQYRFKRKIKYNSICSQANDLLNIRWDISSGTYDAKTCIERLKKLDEQDLHISSLVYPLLELTKLSAHTSDDKTDASIALVETNPPLQLTDDDTLRIPL